MYWYHPHHHGTVADQVFGGLYGAIIVEDPEPLPVSRERVLVVSDLTLDGARTSSRRSADGTDGRPGGRARPRQRPARPQLTARPGERERWRIVNACTSRYLRLRLDGQRLELLGIDSGRFRIAAEVEEFLLAPGNRADLLVTTAAGSRYLQRLPATTGAAWAA